MRRTLFALAWAAAACGDGETEPSAEEMGPDTLPLSVEAPDVDQGFLVVTAERVRQWQESGEPFVLVDARDPVQYGREHIPQAINVPYVDIRAGANLPPRDARIVLYCSDENCPISRYAYETLEALGYTDLYDMSEGIQGWKAAGYPTVIAEAGPAGPAPPDTTPS